MFEIEPDKKYAGVTRISTVLDSGETYYLRVDTALKIRNSLGYEPYERSFSLVEVTEQQAVEEISQCCHSASGNSTDDDDPSGSKASTDETGSSDTGFNVDKTQNPFSH